MHTLNQSRIFHVLDLTYVLSSLKRPIVNIIATILVLATVHNTLAQYKHESHSIKF